MSKSRLDPGPIQFYRTFVTLPDPLLGPAEIERFGAKPVASLQGLEGPVDCIIVNSPHGVFAALTLEKVLEICNGKPIIVDVTGMLRRNDGVREGCVYCTL